MGMDGLPIDARRPLALSVHQLALPADRAAASLVAGARRRGAAVRRRRQPDLGLQHGPAAPVDAGERAGDPRPDAQVAADRGFRQLHALRPLATDYSMASTTLLFDQRRQTWSDELLAASGIDRRLLCDPLPSGTVLGEVHADGGRGHRAARGHAGRAGRPRLLLRRAADRGLPAGRGARRDRHLGDGRGRACPSRCSRPTVRADGHPGRFARGPRHVGGDGRHRGRRHARMVPQASTAPRRSSGPRRKAASIGTT